MESPKSNFGSDASGDQNKIVGLCVAAGRAGWEQFGEKESDAGYVFKKNHGFTLKIDQNQFKALGLSMEALLDCIAQLEAMGPASKVKGDIGYRLHQGFLNNGMTIVSKVDPKVTMSVTYADPDYENTDIMVSWFLDDGREHPEMKMGAPERAVDAGETLAVQQAQAKTPEPASVMTPESVQTVATVVEEDSLELPPMIPSQSVFGSARSRTEDREIEKSLGIRGTAPILPLMEALSSTKGYLAETGEPDQDYDKGFYDKVVAELKKAGFDASHREFDKYQGVYIDVTKGGKKIGRVWGIDSYVRGKTKPSKAKYTNAKLVDVGGNEFSATPGDYFQMGDNETFDDNTLVLTLKDGSTKEIEHPKKKDLPADGEVQTGIDFVGEPDEVIVMQIEGAPEDETAEVVESGKTKKVDASELIGLLKTAGQNERE